MKNSKIFLKYSKLSIILVYNLGTLLGMAIFYPIIPILMGYPKGILELGKKISVSYDLQYILFGIFSVVVGTAFLLFFLNGIGSWQKSVEEHDLKSIEKIREKCINLPYRIFILQIVLVGISVPAIVGVVSFINGTDLSLQLRIYSIVFSLFSIIAVLSHIFSKNLFTGILLKTYSSERLQGRRIGIRSKIFLQIVPMFICAILFTSSLAYSRLMEEKGNLSYFISKVQLINLTNSKSNFKNTADLFDALKIIKVGDSKIGYFAVKKANGEITTSDGYVPGVYFKYYTKNPTEGDRVYGDTTEVQGVVASVKIDGEDYLAGVRFENASNKTISFFLISLLALLTLNILVLYYLSKSLTNEISLVAKGLNEIAEDEVIDFDKKLAVTSNDEIADLVIAFNRIQEREKQHIIELKETQEILAEKERLASLGQLIGGIAHNLRTPIMSMSGSIEALKDLTREAHDSIYDEDVTKDDYFEIVKEMRSWLEKMRPYCSYMSEIISAVKDQTTLAGKDTDLNFTLQELEKRIEILLDLELKKRRCRVIMEFDILRSTVIPGEIGNLVQVINNLILNAAHAYEGEGGDIKMRVVKKGKNVEFSIKDTGCGIPPEIQERLFKEMITTKGKKGTGLGLYMSYSNIKARFGGKIWFESEVGKGTTFYVSIPVE